ncbi:hypothetical protein BGW80DRAFT_1314739 [Lactifluus volemus]|nr:hypothetical protein BGW80DRAFT_1314739 [Lactifluus volemus]
MLFFKLSIAVLAPLAALAVPIPSPASHYRRQDVIPEGISSVPNPFPTVDQGRAPQFCVLPVGLLPDLGLPTSKPDLGAAFPPK